MKDDFASRPWLDRLGKIAAIMIVGAFILTLVTAELWFTPTPRPSLHVGSPPGERG